MNTEEKIKKIISEYIRPALQSHGGDIELMGYDAENGRVTVSLKGACGT